MALPDSQNEKDDFTPSGRKRAGVGRQPFIHHWTTNNGGHNNHQRFLRIKSGDGLLILRAHGEPLARFCLGSCEMGPEETMFIFCINGMQLIRSGFEDLDRILHFTKQTIMLPGTAAIGQRRRPQVKSPSIDSQPHRSTNNRSIISTSAHYCTFIGAD